MAVLFLQSGPASLRTLVRFFFHRSKERSKAGQVYKKSGQVIKKSGQVFLSSYGRKIQVWSGFPK